MKAMARTLSDDVPHSRGPLTIADLQELDDAHYRYELLDGTLIMSPAPSLDHQLMTLNFAYLLKKSAPPGFVVVTAPFAVHPPAVGSDRETELQPDVLVARHSDCTPVDLPGAPLLAIEVLSPSTQLIDLNTKRAAYERIGTPSFWIANPRQLTLDIFELTAAGSYDHQVKVTAADEYAVTQPFPVQLRMRDLEPMPT